jgi:hypothetical protein
MSEEESGITKAVVIELYPPAPPQPSRDDRREAHDREIAALLIELIISEDCDRSDARGLVTFNTDRMLNRILGVCGMARAHEREFIQPAAEALREAVHLVEKLRYT